MPTPTASILLIAGDVSGDVHSAALARKLLERDPGRALHALGGARLREAVARSHGGEFLGDTTNLSAIGIPSAVKVYFRCRGLRERLRAFLRRQHVDLAVLCDWGAFNGRILPEVHALGIPVLYYFPPSSWRRSGSAGLRIAPFVSRAATPFEWSAARLRGAGCAAEWVGHPALETLRDRSARQAARDRFRVAENETLVALLPGSRPSEVRLLAPRMAKAADMLKSRGSVRFIAVVPRELAGEARIQLPPSIDLVTDCASDLLAAADAAIVKTGTATLEAAIAGTPHVAVYDVPPITRIEWLLLWAWQRIPFYAMPNIILQREVVPELIGLRCTPERIVAAVQRILSDAAMCAQMQEGFAEMRTALGAELPLSATERTADVVEEMLIEAKRDATAPGVAA